ncbi:MAG: hypothetical protein ABI536_07945 [Gallionella sp.]
MAGRMMIRGQKTEDMTSDLASVNQRLTSPSLGDLAEWLCKAVCSISRMASCFIRGQRVGAAVPRMIFSVFCLLSSVFCSAEDLPDPTRPPSGIFAPAGGGGMGAGSGAWRERAESHSSGLHTIIISDTRRAAIIDGKTVELGDEHGGARLIEVNEGGVVLQRAQNRQVLTLFPHVKILRKKMPDEESAEPPVQKSSDQESSVNQPSPANKVHSGKHRIRPTAHDEKLLSGHPKEKK